MTFPKYDECWNEYKIRSVVSRGTGHDLCFDSAWMFMAPLYSEVPRAGQTARLYGKGTGYPVRGLFIDGVEVFYRTFNEEEAKNKREMEDLCAQREKRLEEEREDRDARRAALPKLFQARLIGMESRGPHWRREHESYELFTCEQAVLIADGARSVDFQAFRKLPFEEQKKLVPGLSDAHSNNSFGAAVHLAELYVMQPQELAKTHAAICPLVGCGEAGCWASRS
jgi:hypothetical protein